MLQLRRFAPSPRLTPYVKSYLFVDSDSETESRVLPDTSIVLAFRYRGKITDGVSGIVEGTLPRTAISGIRSTSHAFRYAAQTSTLLVAFNEGGPAAFFRFPLNRLFGMSIALEEMLPALRVREVEERLAEARDDRQRRVLVDGFLLSLLDQPQSDRLILEAAQNIKRAHGAMRVDDLLPQIPLSRDAFEKRFRRIVGTSPKHYAGIVRLRYAIETYPKARSLTELALAAGFFDQAHFANTFRKFTGQAPGEFFKGGAIW